MQKGVIAYIAIFVVLVIAAYFLFTTYGGNKGAQTTTIITTIIRNVTTTASVINGTTSLTTTSQSTTTIYAGSCVSKNATVTIPNGNFSAGTYADWNISGAGFGTAPLNLTQANKQGGYFGNEPWNSYYGTFVATSFRKGLGLQAGNLTSNTFNVSELYLNFKIISQQSNLLYVEVLDNNTPRIVTHYNTYASTNNASSTFVNATIPLGTVICQPVSIRIVAGVTGLSSQGTNFIAAGDFYLSRTPGINLTQPASQNFYN